MNASLFSTKTKSKSGIVLLEVAIALAIFAFAGVGLATALRQSARLQAEINAELLLEQELKNAIAQGRHFVALEEGNLSLVSHHDDIQLSASAQQLDNLTDQFAYPIGGPPGRPKGFSPTKNLPSLSTTQETDTQASSDSNSNSAQLWEINITATYRPKDAQFAKLKRQTLIWVAVDGRFSQASTTRGTSEPVFIE